MLIYGNILARSQSIIWDKSTKGTFTRIIDDYVSLRAICKENMINVKIKRKSFKQNENSCTDYQNPLNTFNKSYVIRPRLQLQKGKTDIFNYWPNFGLFWFLHQSLGQNYKIIKKVQNIWPNSECIKNLEKYSAGNFCLNKGLYDMKWAPLGWGGFKFENWCRWPNYIDLYTRIIAISL